MPKRVLRASILTLALTLCISCGTKPGDGDIPLGDFSRKHLIAEDYVVEIDSIRVARAASFMEDASGIQSTQDICAFVADHAKERADEMGWVITALARKHRNPANYPDEIAVSVIERFEDIPELESVWERILTGEKPGWRYFLPIYIKPSCLACHGDKQAVPLVIQEAYPEDKAHDFMVGDMYGVYSVFVPDSSLLSIEL